MTATSAHRRNAAVTAWGRTAERLGQAGVAWAVLGVAMAAYAALALWITRGTTMFVDEANILIVDRGFRPSALLTPLNGHFVLLQRLVFALDVRLFGADFVPLQIVEVAGVVLVVGLLYELARRRIGNAAALAPAVLLLFLGSVWELNFVVSGIGNVYASAAGLGALLCLERRDRRGDLAACALLLVSVCSFTTGVAFAVGALVLWRSSRARAAACGWPSCRSPPTPRGCCGSAWTTCPTTARSRR